MEGSTFIHRFYQSTSNPVMHFLHVRSSLSLRGPAPLHHTIINGDKYTGVTLQTLHPEKFDHGTILAQTPPPGFIVPSYPHATTYKGLHDFITPKAAEMLVRGIRDRLFDPNRLGEISKSMPSPSYPEDRPTRHAPKITTNDRYIDFSTMTADEILRRHRALGRLHSFFKIDGGPKRVIFDTLTSFSPETILSIEPPAQDFTQNLFAPDGKTPAGTLECTAFRTTVRVPCLNGAVFLRHAIVEGKAKTSARTALFQSDGKP
jgi:methionyl-tRNA formyltransferase